MYQHVLKLVYMVHAKEARQVLADLQQRAEKLQKASSMEDAGRPASKKAAVVEKNVDDDVEPTQVVETQESRPVPTPARAPVRMVKGISSDAQPREQELWDQRFGSGNESSLNYTAWSIQQ